MVVRRLHVEKEARFARFAFAPTVASIVESEEIETSQWKIFSEPNV